jgi:hypothetical protein
MFMQPINGNLTQQRKTMKNLMKRKGGILLDIGAGDHRRKGFVTLDRRAMDGIDIVHDLEVFPYPLKDESCLTIVGSHIVEHIKPWLMVDFMNELWRIAKVDGQLALALPYAVSFGFVQDPTHCNPCNEATWQYFDPKYNMYNVYSPKPWEIEKGYPQWDAGNLEVVMRKIKEPDGSANGKEKTK